MAIKPIFRIEKDIDRAGASQSKVKNVKKAMQIKERFHIVMGLRCEMLEDITKQEYGSCDYLKQHG